MINVWHTIQDIRHISLWGHDKRVAHCTGYKTLWGHDGLIAYYTGYKAHIAMGS